MNQYVYVSTLGAGVATPGHAYCQPGVVGTEIQIVGEPFGDRQQPLTMTFTEVEPSE